MLGKVHLTKREAEVLRLIARGCTQAQAGAALGVSQNTVASHLKSAYRKLDAHSAVAAVMRAMELHLLGSTKGGKR
jgi:DNA-binding CsgD family transcriptional regulator